MVREKRIYIYLNIFDWTLVNGHDFCASPSFGRRRRRHESTWQRLYWICENVCSYRWQRQYKFTSFWIHSNDMQSEMPKRWHWAYRQLNSERNGREEIRSTVKRIHNKKGQKQLRKVECVELVCFIIIIIIRRRRRRRWRRRYFPIHMFMWISFNSKRSLIVFFVTKINSFRQPLVYCRRRFAINIPYFTAFPFNGGFTYIFPSSFVFFLLLLFSRNK